VESVWVEPYPDAALTGGFQRALWALGALALLALAASAASTAGPRSRRSEEGQTKTDATRNCANHSAAAEASLDC
jgi:hypothetical protein